MQTDALERDLQGKTHPGFVKGMNQAELKFVMARAGVML
jgi:hypothetical protein